MAEGFDVNKLSRDELIAIIAKLQAPTPPGATNSAAPAARNQFPKNFTPRSLPTHTKHLIIGTSSRVRDLYARRVAFNCVVHTYGGATLEDLAAVIDKYDPKQLSSVTLVGGFNDASSTADDSTFKTLWEKVTNSIVTKFSPKSVIIPDTIPSTKKAHSARIEMIQTSLQSFFMENKLLGSSKLYNPRLNPIFHITDDFVGSAFFMRDGIHLSAIGTNLLTSFLAGFIRSLHVLSEEDRAEMSNIKSQRGGYRQQQPREQQPRQQQHGNSMPNTRFPQNNFYQGYGPTFRRDDRRNGNNRF